MRSLFRKELRSLRPFLALVLFFVALNWVFLGLSEFPDQYPLSKLLSDDNRGSTQFMMFIVALALAAGLLVRERDEGTLAFLDALPVSRAQVFGVKLVLALGVLWVLPVSDWIFNATIYSWSRTSLDSRFHWTCSRRRPCWTRSPVSFTSPWGWRCPSWVGFPCWCSAS